MLELPDPASHYRLWPLFLQALSLLLQERSLPLRLTRNQTNQWSDLLADQQTSRSQPVPSSKESEHSPGTPSPQGLSDSRSCQGVWEILVEQLWERAKKAKRNVLSPGRCVQFSVLKNNNIWRATRGRLLFYSHSRQVKQKDSKQEADQRFECRTDKNKLN